MQRYELNILQDNKIFINYKDSIGSFENENYSILFKNNTNEPILINILINGINILSGTNNLEKKWQVSAYGKIKLSAWQESQKGGSEFRFTKEDIIKINIYERSNFAETKAWILTNKEDIKFDNYEALKVMEIKPYFLSNNFKEQPVKEVSCLGYALTESLEIKCENWTGLQSKMRGNRKIGYMRFMYA